MPDTKNPSSQPEITLSRALAKSARRVLLVLLVVLLAFLVVAAMVYAVVQIRAVAPPWQRLAIAMNEAVGLQITTAIMVLGYVMAATIIYAIHLLVKERFPWKEKPKKVVLLALLLLLTLVMIITGPMGETEAGWGVASKVLLPLSLGQIVFSVAYLCGVAINKNESHKDPDLEGYLKAGVEAGVACVFNVLLLATLIMLFEADGEIRGMVETSHTTDHVISSTINALPAADSDKEAAW